LWLYRRAYAAPLAMGTSFPTHYHPPGTILALAALPSAA
jgi:hypothetical protein